MNRFKFLLASVIVSSFLITSCKDDDKLSLAYENGAFITNEGAWNNTNATVSFYDFSSGTIINDIFQKTNSRPIGDVLQSACISSDKIFFVLNNSNKIEVANAGDMEEISTVEGLNNPRYITANNGSAYITQWGDGGKVKVLNTRTLAITKTIAVGNGPEGILSFNNQIWVANSGGYSYDSTITVINATTNEVVKTIKLDNKSYCPQQFVVDSNNDIWVLCSGFVDYYANPITHTPSKLIKISSSTYEVLKSFTISQDQHPIRLSISNDGNTLYFGGGYTFTGIYAFGTTATTLPSTPIVNELFYGFNINPENNEIFGLKAPSFTENGKLRRFSSTGQFISEYTVGIGPNNVIF